MRGVGAARTESYEGVRNAGRWASRGGDGPGWEVDPEDEWGVAVLVCVGGQLKLWREAAGMRVVDFAKAIGYGEDMVYKVESGMRIPRRSYLDKADSVLGAGGRVSAMWDDVEKVKYSRGR